MLCWRAVPEHNFIANIVATAEIGRTECHISLISLAHPRGFEPLASAFGGNIAGSAKKRKEPPMTAYHTEKFKQFAFGLRRTYSSVRHSFRPRAYVVLTREEAVGSEEAHV